MKFFVGIKCLARTALAPFPRSSILKQSYSLDANSIVKEFVSKNIQHDRIVVFSKTFCPFCNMAKKVLEIKNTRPHIVEIDGHPYEQQIQDELKKISGVRTVPQVFVDKKFVGGYDDLRSLENSGQLDGILHPQKK